MKKAEETVVVKTQIHECDYVPVTKKKKKKSKNLRIRRKGMPASQAKTKVETKKFYYFNPIDCITKMMNQNSMKDWEWDYNQNGGNIEHPSNAKGWKEYEKLKMKLEAVNQDKKYKLLCPMIYIDEFQSQKNRKKKVYGIYLLLGNLPRNDLIQNKYYRCLLGLIPSDVDIDLFIKKVVTEPLKALEAGLTVELKNGEKIDVCGSLFALLGDSPGLSSFMQLRGMRANCASRYTYSLKEFLSASYGKMPRKRKGKDIKLLQELLSRIKNRSLKEGDICKALLIRLGYKQQLSSLWDLLWFSQDPWKRLGICYLHESLWGNFKRHLIFLAVKYGKEFTKNVHGRLKQVNWYPSLKKRVKKIFITKYDKKAGRIVMDLNLFTAEHMNAFLQVSSYCLYGLINEFDYYVWSIHLRADSIICKDAISQDEIEQLKKYTLLWREGYKMSFTNPSKVEKDKQEKERNSFFLLFFRLH